MKPTNKPAKKLSVKLTTLKELSSDELRRVQGGIMVITSQISLKSCANNKMP